MATRTAKSSAPSRRCVEDPADRRVRVVGRSRDARVRRPVDRSRSHDVAHRVSPEGQDARGVALWVRRLVPAGGRASVCHIVAAAAAPDDAERRRRDRTLPMARGPGRSAASVPTSFDSGHFGREAPRGVVLPQRRGRHRVPGRRRWSDRHRLHAGYLRRPAFDLGAATPRASCRGPRHSRPGAHAGSPRDGPVGPGP